MSVSINDLNPRNSTFKLNGKEYELKKFSLAIQVWANDEFATPENKNGLEVLSQKVTNLDADAIARCCYRMLVDKSDFGSFENFLDKFKDYYTLLEVLLIPFSECLGVSQPSKEDIEEDLELKK